MHISKLSLVNYRNFANAKFVFKKGINTIIGENGSGKTNLFRAIRLLLDENMRRSAVRLDQSDFNRSLDNWKGHWIIISLEFEEISQDETIQSLFLHGVGNVGAERVEKATYNLIFRPRTEIRVRLSKLEDGDTGGLAAIRQEISIADYETILTGKSEADFNDKNMYKEIVGDFDLVRFNNETEFPVIGAKVPGIFSITQDISFTFIQALRDVISEFQNNRTNPLLTLLKAKSGELNPAVFGPIKEMARSLNASIVNVAEIQTLRSDIKGTIKEAAGHTYSPSSLSIKSELSEEADKLFQSLKLFIGESDDGYEGAIHELSLGGANLIYLTLKLLEFKYQKTKQSFANFLLIEEPEAHIHTHIQKTLFDRLNYADTQVIYSTHSTHISEASNVRNINILGRNGSVCEAYQPTVGLTETQTGNIQRYLDAVRSNLLFAKSVLLVEGDAEEILIPILVKKLLGLSLDEMGISLVNIRSTGFENVAVLFHHTRIRKRCSIVTDLDAAIIETTPIPGDTDSQKKFKENVKGSHESGVRRKAKLDTFVGGNAWLRLFMAPHTFEVDFVGAGNENKVVSVLGDVYSTPGKIAEAKDDLESGDIARYGKRVLTIANQEGKGWFAILLGKTVDHTVVIPNYILDALFFAHPILSTEVWFHILSYRIRCIEIGGQMAPELLADVRTKLGFYRTGARRFEEIRNDFLAAFATDRIIPVLKRF